MRKFAIFTEGQSELIFIRELLPRLLGYENVSFKCFRLHSEIDCHMPYDMPNPNAEYYFQIVDVGNDNKVLSIIANRERKLFALGFEKILGLRDMYSEEYKKYSKTKIDESLNNRFIAAHQVTVQAMSIPEKIRFFFAIMEFEAWFLSMYNLFCKIDPALSLENIQDRLGIDLKTLSPENEFFHPASFLNRLLELANIRYDKSEHIICRIVAMISNEDINNALEEGKCDSFAKFYSEIIEL